jgi:hypothetical protein
VVVGDGGGYVRVFDPTKDPMILALGQREEVATVMLAQSRLRTLTR